LAAGQGKRLHPITVTRSKAMQPVAGKPIVERVMDLLAANGVSDFVLVISPDDKEITQYFQKDSDLEADVRFVYQVERKGMAHALMAAAPLISEDFILSACDNLVAEADVAQLVRFWQTTPRPNAILTLMPVAPERIRSGATVGLDGPWITRIIEKPRPEEILSDLASLPLYLFSPRILDYLPEVPLSARGEYELQDAIQMLIARDGRVGSEVVDRRLTLTDAADLLAINHDYLMRDAGSPHLKPHSVGPNTQLITPLRVEQDVCIGRDCIIGPNVYVERGCHIGNGVTLRDAVVLRSARVADGETKINQVVA